MWFPRPAAPPRRAALGAAFPHENAAVPPAEPDLPRPARFPRLCVRPRVAGRAAGGDAAAPAHAAAGLAEVCVPADPGGPEAAWRAVRAGADRAVPGGVPRPRGGVRGHDADGPDARVGGAGAVPRAAAGRRQGDRDPRGRAVQLRPRGAADPGRADRGDAAAGAAGVRGPGGDQGDQARAGRAARAQAGRAAGDPPPRGGRAQEAPRDPALPAGGAPAPRNRAAGAAPLPVPAVRAALLRAARARRPAVARAEGRVPVQARERGHRAVRPADHRRGDAQGAAARGHTLDPQADDQGGRREGRPARGRRAAGRRLRPTSLPRAASVAGAAHRCLIQENSGRPA